jgi:hypothetical protein
MLGAVVPVALVCALWTAAQYQVVNALHEAIEQIRADCLVPDARETASPVLPSVAVEVGEPAEGDALAGALSTDREALERRGADLLAANNHQEALGHYRLLVRLSPHDRAFRDLVAVLEAKLGCRTAQRSTSPPCL